MTKICVAVMGLLLWVSPGWCGEVGQVIAWKAGVQAERGGQTVPLALKSPVMEGDALSTDATGRAQILLADDSTVSLGSGTRLQLESVVAKSSKPRLAVRMGQGLARFITGKIVEKNPDGFSVVTPEATVGIRGTIFTVRVSEGQTTVYVANTTRQVHVNGVLVPTGFKITVPHGRPVPLLPEDMAAIDGEIAARDPARDSVAPVAAAPGGAILTGSSLPVQSSPPVAALAPQPLAAEAFVSGTLVRPAGVNHDGSFQFNVNLGSGRITNGVMLLDRHHLSGGRGQISGGALSAGGFADSTHQGTMNGTATVSSGHLAVSGSYEIVGGVPPLHLTGTFSGQQQ